MAFKMGGGGGLTNEPNVVPMIDILLVLLIIFMIMQPLARKSVDLQLPDPTPQDKPPDAKPDQIILEILPNGTFAVNKEPMTRDNLARRLKEIYDPRPEKIMFVKGDPEALYQDVVWAMDMARGSGVKVIGITPIDVK